MKNLIVIFFFLFSKNLLSLDYYHYFSEQINLEKRLDKMAVILNTADLSDDFILRKLEENVSVSGKISKVTDDIYLVNFISARSESEIENYRSMIESKNSFIKFVTFVYFGESEQVTQIPADEIVVRLKNPSDKSRLEFIAMQNSLTIKGNVSDEKGFLLKSDFGIKKNALELSEIFYRTGIFEFSEPNFFYPEGCLLHSDPNDANYPQQWALNNTGQAVPTGGNVAQGDQTSANGLTNADMDVNLAWDYTQGSSFVKVAVFDTGIDSTHPDFQSAGHLLSGYDATLNINSVPIDTAGISSGHGTCCAGIIGAVRNNMIGTAGIAPNCQLMSIKIFNINGTASSVWIARGFDTARVRGIDILSNSWGGGSPEAVIENSINNAATQGRNNKGCIILFSSGNNGRNPPEYPSYLEKVICVGASTTNDQKKSPGTGNEYFWGGNYGGTNTTGYIDVVAPTICYATDIQAWKGFRRAAGTAGDYDSVFNGTSCSCPNAAGIAALILSVNTSQNRITVFRNLVWGCNKIDNVKYEISPTDLGFGWNEYNGYGRVNALNSVRLAANTDLTPPLISHKNVSSHSSTYPTKIYAEISDQDLSQVPTTGVYRPRLIYRFNKNNSGWSAYDTADYKSKSSPNFLFEIPSVGYETEVQYYIIAFDVLGNKNTFPFHAPDVDNLCYFKVGSMTTTSNTTGAFLASDFAGGFGNTFSANVNFGNLKILNTAVTVNLTHGRLSDEIIQLVSPDANSHYNRKSLFVQNVGANLTNTVIADSASRFFRSGAPPFTGLFKPDYLLNGFNGKNANGNWRILSTDKAPGFAPNFTNVNIRFTHTTGATSPSIRVDNPSDSIIDFGELHPADSVVRTLFFKNVGNANLDIIGLNWSEALQDIKNSNSVKGANEVFEIINFSAGPIAPGDSGYVQILVKYENVVTEYLQKKVLNIVNTDPSKSTFKISVQGAFIPSTYSVVQIKAFLEGFYNKATRLMNPDTLYLSLRSAGDPYNEVGFSKVYLSSAGAAEVHFAGAPQGLYYLKIQHRNSLETWSNVFSIVNSFAFCDFTSSLNSVYGSNCTRINTLPDVFGIFGGDINHDGVIDLFDLAVIDNAAYLFSSGYVDEDVTGDNFVDLADLAIADNNAFNFVFAVIP